MRSRCSSFVRAGPQPCAVRRRLRKNTRAAAAHASATMPPMKNGSQLSPAESAAICGTEWPAELLRLTESGPPGPVSDALLAPPFCPLCDEPPADLLSLALALVALESLEPPFAVWPVDDESGATGIVVGEPPLVFEPLVLPPLPPPGSAEPYWSPAGEPASATGAAISPTAATQVIPSTMRSKTKSLLCPPCIEVPPWRLWSLANRHHSTGYEAVRGVRRPSPAGSPRCPSRRRRCRARPAPARPRRSNRR